MLRTRAFSPWICSMCLRKLPSVSCSERKTNGWVRSKMTSLWAHSNLFCPLPSDGNLNCWSMPRDTTVFPKPSLRAPLRVGNFVVDRRNAGWTTSKSGGPCPCQNCSRCPPPEDWEGSSAESSLMSPNDPIRWWIHLT